METAQITKSQEDSIKISDSIHLIKFSKEFIPKYHKWMQDEQLCALVDTEPLDLAGVTSAQQYANNPNSPCKQKKNNN